MIDYSILRLGLFRANVSQTDVRMLLSQIVDVGVKVFHHNVPDLYHVAEVLHLCLKNLKLPLFHEIYSNAITDGKQIAYVYGYDDSLIMMVMIKVIIMYVIVIMMILF